MVIVLVWKPYDTGRLWYLSPQLHRAIGSRPVSTLRGLYWEGGYADLVRLLVNTDHAEWDDVPLGQSERPAQSRFVQGVIQFSTCMVFIDVLYWKFKCGKS